MPAWANSTTSASRSVRFDGTNDYVNIPSSSSLSPTSKVSVEAWIKPNALPSVGNFASVASKAEDNASGAGDGALAFAGASWLQRQT